MIRNSALTALFLLGFTASVDSSASAETTEIAISTMLHAPDQKSRGSGSVVAKIESGYSWTMNLDNYSLHFVVEEWKSRALSIQIRLDDRNGETLDSGSVLAVSTGYREFKLSSAPVSVSGTILIRKHENQNGAF